MNCSQLGIIALSLFLAACGKPDAPPEEPRTLYFVARPRSDG